MIYHLDLSTLPVWGKKKKKRKADFFFSMEKRGEKEKAINRGCHRLLECIPHQF